MFSIKILESSRVEEALFFLSISNFTIAAIEDLIHVLEITARCYRVIRNGLFSRLTATTKSKLLEFARFLKEARMELGVAVEQLQQRPAAGSLFVAVQRNLFNSLSGIT
jgi:hypothetical protein